jgi:hypothetical protein
MNAQLKENFYSHTMIENKIAGLIPDIKAGKVSPYQVGTELITDYLASQ